MRALVLLVLASCWYSGNLGAGTRRPDFGNERDPDPFADPNRQITESPYVSPEKGQASPRTATERSKKRQAKSTFWGSVFAAGLALGTGGWLPLVQTSGKFEEDPDQAARYEADDEAAAAEAAAKKMPVAEPAPEP